MARIEIVSHPLCPHAQRLVLVGLANGWQKDRDFKVTYLDLRTLKQAVGAHSPTGEIPAFKIDGVCATTTTEHAAEYFDQVAGGTLMPAEPLTRLLVRERERKVRGALDALRGVFTAPTAEVMSAAIDALFGHLATIDADLARDGTDDATTRMDMVALAPMFSLVTFHRGLRDDPKWDAIPRLRDLGRRIAADPTVIASRCPNYDAEFETFFSVTKSAFPQVIAV